MIIVCISVHLSIFKLLKVALARCLVQAMDHHDAHCHHQQSLGRRATLLRQVPKSTRLLKHHIVYNI